MPGPGQRPDHGPGRVAGRVAALSPADRGRSLATADISVSSATDLGLVPILQRPAEFLDERLLHRHRTPEVLRLDKL